MTTRLLALVLGILCLAAAAETHTQSRTTPARGSVNPLQDQPAAIRNGQAIFRARCAGCHGFDARGLTAPDLTGLWAAGLSDQQLFQIVRRGVPGSEMPPFDSRSQEDEIWETLAYLRTLNVTESGPAVLTGDRDSGERLFRAQCQRCHVVNGSGGVLGPDLSRIGSARPRTVLAGKIRTGKPVRSGYEAVTLVTANGQQIRGVKKNEDDFSIQIMDLRERLHGYLKRDLVRIVYEPQSVMPTYSAQQLSATDLDDLLRYLATLRITGAS